MEVWDAYYEDGSKADTTLVRGKNIPEGLFHIIVETLIRHSDGTFLLMRRDLNKSSNPGLYEGSAGGSVLQGETVENGARREVEEETGLIINKLIPIYRFTYPKRNAITQGFITNVSGDKDNIKLQQGETIGYKWINLEDLKKFISTELYNQDHRPRLLTYLNKL